MSRDQDKTRVNYRGKCCQPWWNGRWPLENNSREALPSSSFLRDWIIEFILLRVDWFLSIRRWIYFSFFSERSFVPYRPCYYLDNFNGNRWRWIVTRHFRVVAILSRFEISWNSVIYWIRERKKEDKDSFP